MSAAPRITTWPLNPARNRRLTNHRSIFKEQRALRTETTINDPLDFQRTKGLDTLPHLRAIGRQINTKLLNVERIADGAIPTPSFFERLQLPTLSPTGQRVSALRFGDPRVQALLAALCRFSHLPSGFQNRDLRPLVAALLGRNLASHTAGAMTYDLRRLRLHGVIRRAPRSLRYTLTPNGLRAAFLYTTLYRRLRRPPPPLPRIHTYSHLGSMPRSTTSTPSYKTSGAHPRPPPDLDSSVSHPIL